MDKTAKSISDSISAPMSPKVAKNKQRIIDNSQVMRMKSAMVLYELERTLGDFVCNEARSTKDLPLDTLQGIRNRESQKRGNFDDSSPEKIIAVTYLDEVFGLAQGAAKGRPEEKYLLGLRRLFDVLDVFDIRNAISHPNRPFHPSYWYRVAAIATDPLIDKLQFRGVTRAFLDAEEGKLSSPPETWMNAPIWSLPNNLPEQFDHHITGLIGRQREVEELKKLLANERLNLIAVVAPGGLGKTALLLQVLQDVIHSPQSTEWVDRVLYFSSKTEILTTEGIIEQNPITITIESICQSITATFAEQEGLEISSFEDVCREFDSHRILLCLDNLETILRDEPTKFENFYRSLPREWRVVVTSRITVNSATTIPLNPLSTGGAKALARNYISKRGGEELSEQELEILVQSCDMNPLAIRLTIDGFLVGKKSLNEMQTIAKQQVIDFSYRNLIEALSPASHELLECLFVLSEPVSRTKACTLLHRDLDEISEAFNQIRGTSLITRTPGQTEECYTLSSSVRDLLVIRPVNQDARIAIQTELRKTKQLVSEINKYQQDTNPLARDYIPHSALDEVKVVAASAWKALVRSVSSREQLFDCLERLRQVIKLQDDPILHRFSGLILLRLGDRTQGKQELKRAFEMEPSDVAAGSLLSNEFRKDQELQDAFLIAERLVKDGWDDPKLSSPFHAGLVIQSYFLPLIWRGETEQVIDRTINWKLSGTVRGTLGTLRAIAFRQSVESERDINHIQDALCQAVNVLDEVFNLEGYAGFQVGEGMKLIEQLVYSRRGNQELSEESKLKFVYFINKHLVTLCQEHNSYTLSSPEVIKWIQEMSNLSLAQGKINLLKSDRWQSLIKSSAISFENNELLEEGSIQSTVESATQNKNDKRQQPRPKKRLRTRSRNS